jgi:D-3-phosphoglycerate dehydrogenase
MAHVRALLLESLDPRATELLSAAGIDVINRAGAMDQDELIAALEGIELLGIRSATQVTAKVLESAPSLIAIGTFSIGTNQIDLASAARLGIPVFNAPFANTRSVVELAIAEIIGLMRRLPEHNRSLQDGVWSKSSEGSHEVRGRTLGIIGYGNIGSQLSVIAEALGMKVVFFDIAEKLALGNATKAVTIADVLEVADFVSLHVDGRPGNAGFFGAKEFALMKEGSIFLNLSRGFVVDIEALRASMVEGHIAGAAIDVFAVEPKKKGDEFLTPLRELGNVFLTPHIGGSTEEAQRDIGIFVAARLRDYVEQGSTSLSVNLPSLSLEAQTGTHRVALIHENVPGVLAAVNNVFATHGVNIEGQLLGTRGELGYVVTDVAAGMTEDAIAELRAMPSTVRLRTIS